MSTLIVAGVISRRKSRLDHDLELELGPNPTGNVRHKKPASEKIRETLFTFKLHKITLIWRVFSHSSGPQAILCWQGRLQTRRSPSLLSPIQWWRLGRRRWRIPQRHQSWQCWRKIHGWISTCWNFQWKSDRWTWRSKPNRWGFVRFT